MLFRSPGFEQKADPHAPAVVADLLRARVPLVLHMPVVDGEGVKMVVYCLADRHHLGILINDARVRPLVVALPVDAIPDLDERAAFLLCVDELERRIGSDAVGWRSTVRRGIGWWADAELRAEMIAALARALAETAS